jgi:HSP20 family protein
MIRFSPRVWEPAIDMYETPQAVVVVAELAGLKQEDIDITLHAKTLIISGERIESQERNERTYYQMEISRGHFERGILLPAAVDTEKAKASYHDGILQIVLPKRMDEQIRKIDIRTA